MPARALLFGLPALFIALTLWSAQQARLNRQLRQDDLFALVSDPGSPHRSILIKQGKARPRASSLPWFMPLFSS